MNTSWNTLLANWSILQSVNISWFRIWNLNLKEPNFLINNFAIHTNIENNKYRNPFYDGYSSISYYIRWWTIDLWITIKWETQEKFMENINLLRQEIFNQDVFLYLEINWVKRKVKVSCTNNPLDFKNYNKNFLKTTINFSYNDFFLDLETGQDLFFSQTGDFIANISNKWTQKTELEIIFVFLEETNCSKVEIIWENETISIENSFQEWDILKIDNRNWKVLKNDLPVDFDGELLFLDVNTNRFDFKFTGDVKCDVFVLYDIKYK